MLPSNSRQRPIGRDIEGVNDVAVSISRCRRKVRIVNDKVATNSEKGAINVPIRFVPGRYALFMVVVR